jgi:hypothetical protein
VNIMGNAVAAVAMASLEGELDGSRMLRVLNGAPPEELPAGNAIRAHVQCAPVETNRGTSI